MFNLVLTIFFTTARAFAADSVTDLSPAKVSEKPQAMFLDYDVFTRESIVEVSGKKYRKVEFKGQEVYLQLMSSETSGSDLQVICGSEFSNVTNSTAPNQIYGAVKVTKRSSLFVDGLRRICLDQQGGQKIVIDPNIRIGFIFDEGDDKALLKNKRIFIAPGMRGLGFSAEW